MSTKLFLYGCFKAITLCLLSDRQALFFIKRSVKAKRHPTKSRNTEEWDQVVHNRSWKNCSVLDRKQQYLCSFSLCFTFGISSKSSLLLRKGKQRRRSDSEREREETISWSQEGPSTRPTDSIVRE